MGSGHSSVLFHVPAREIARRTILQFARKLEQEVLCGGAFCCLITSDDELRRLNRQFRKRDYATDVLSFPSGGADIPAPEECSPCTAGEIAISLEHAERQARELAHSTQEELQVLMLHGVLHLTGLDHERDRGEMALAESRWRKHFGLPAGLIERALP